MRQEDTICPKLLTIVLAIMSKMINWEHMGVNIDGKKPNHFVFCETILYLQQIGLTIQ